MVFQQNLLSFSSLSLVYDPYEHVPIPYGVGTFFDSGRLLLFNILNFVYQPVVAQPDMWSNVFEFAKKYSRKSTDMSLLCRHMEYFTTTTEPPINLSKSDFAIVRIVTVTMQHMLGIWVVRVTGNLGCNR